MRATAPAFQWGTNVWMSVMAESTPQVEIDGIGAGNADRKDDHDQHGGRAGKRGESPTGSPLAATRPSSAPRIIGKI